MKTVPFKLTADVATSYPDENGDPAEDTGHIDVELERHVPESEFEKQLYSQTITYAIWLSTKHNGDERVPIKFIRHLTKIYAAYLYFAPWHWDETGRLRGTVRIRSEGPLLKGTKHHGDFEYPVYYSLVSSLESTSDSLIRILCEFEATPFSKKNYWSMVSLFSKMNGWSMSDGVRFDSRLLPRLEVPVGHSLYQEEPAPSDDSFQVEDVDLQGSWEDEQGDSTESWLAGMSADERAATMNNMDWND